MTRRTDAIRLDPGPPSDIRNIGRSHAVQGKAVERQDLKAIDALRKRRTAQGTAQADASEATQSEMTFASLHNSDTLNEILTEFVRPRIADVSIIRHAAQLLGEYIDGGLMPLEGNGNLRSLTVALIDDEISRHNSFSDRLREETSTDKSS
ncbi:hypothetical protein WH297_17385 [Ochrobactrum vermis]|uniref:Uncharacterized protein n=1 Tax=Ochrobactrum vermis TaxID=1827297 RepID=A0ABU8PGW5_9HYPH|nr:hypothetical protein [Ochrobactrum vermis]PQZ25849.1 hypothetical protein CQZ93_17670 [Ochrobactrum vermis]